MYIDKKAVGMRISAIRKNEGKTLEEFGKSISNASKSIVSKWERGDTIPNNKRIKIIADKGNLSTDELLYGNLTNFVWEFLHKNYSISYVNVSQIKNLINTLEEKEVRMSDLEEIKRTCDEMIPIWKVEFEKEVDDLLNFIRNNKQYKDEAFTILSSENEVLVEKFEDILDDNYEFSFEEKIKYFSNIESIETAIYTIIEKPTYITDTYVNMIDKDDFIENINDIDKLSSFTKKHIEYISRNKAFPSQYNNLDLLVNIKENTACDYLKSGTHLLIHYFIDLNYKLLKKFFLSTNVVLILNNEIYLGYINNDLIFTTSIHNNKKEIDININLEKYKIYPIAAIFYSE